MSTILLIWLSIILLSWFKFYFWLIFYYIWLFFSYLWLPLNVISSYIYPVWSFVYFFYYISLILLLILFIYHLTSKSVKSHD